MESYDFTGDVPGASVFNLPFPIGAIHRVSDNHLLLTECDSQRFVLVCGYWQYLQHMYVCRWYILESSEGRVQFFEGETSGNLFPCRSFSHISPIFDRFMYV